MQTILIVDDEPSLLNIWRRVLERKNFNVLTAAAGDDVIALYREHYATISAVVLDFGLPKLDGTQVFLQLKEINPKIPVLVVSGYLDPKATDGLRSFQNLAFLQKPFVPSSLLAKINALLERS